MRLIDGRFSGIARGVGTAKILGRVHSAQLRLADLYLPCSFTIMEVSLFCLLSLQLQSSQLYEGRDVDLLLGLDMLKAHQACIDLEKSVLRIQGREVRFLSEHELPEQARLLDSQMEDPSASTSDSSSSAPQPARLDGAGSRGPSFPGGGNTLGSAPAPRASMRPAAAQTPHPESAIRLMMDLGASRELAISTLDAAGGNVDVAASLLF